jgi:hypothetical protein
MAMSVVEALPAGPGHLELEVGSLGPAHPHEQQYDPAFTGAGSQSPRLGRARPHPVGGEDDEVEAVDQRRHYSPPGIPGGGCHHDESLKGYAHLVGRDKTE